MTTLAEVRDGLFTAIDSIDGLRVYDHVPDNVFYPAAVIFPPTNTDYSGALGRRGFTVRFVVMLMVPAVIDRQQLDLYPLLDRTGLSSVFAVIEEDRTLGGLDVDCQVVSAEDPLDLGRMAETAVYQRAVIVEALIS